MHFKELPQATGQVSTLTKIRTRRRPGRKTQVNQHLIPLLRDPTTVDIPEPVGELDVPSLIDGLAPIQGIIVALVLSVPLWGGIAGVLWKVWH